MTFYWRPYSVHCLMTFVNWSQNLFCMYYMPYLQATLTAIPLSQMDQEAKSG